MLQSMHCKESDKTEQLNQTELKMKRASLLVLVLEDLVALHRTIQLQHLQHYRLGHRLGLL